MTVESESTADSFAVRYVNHPVDPALMGVGAIIAGSVVLTVLLTTAAHPGPFLVLIEIGLAGLVLFGVAVLATGKRQEPPTTVITRFTRAQQVRIEVVRGIEPPQVTDLAFADIADVRVFSFAGSGSTTDRMLIVPREGTPIEVAAMTQRGLSARPIPGLAQELRAWTGLPGPEVSLLAKVVQWTSGWGHS